MPIFARIDKNTGEFHKRNCSKCGLTTISGDFTPEQLDIFVTASSDELHTLIEITQAEKDALVQQIVIATIDGKDTELTEEEANLLDWNIRKKAIYERKYAIELTDKPTYIKDRVTEPDMTKPIEIESMGGKEIIGYEQKPESIIIERSVRVIKAESELEK